MDIVHWTTRVMHGPLPEESIDIRRQESRPGIQDIVGELVTNYLLRHLQYFDR